MYAVGLFTMLGTRWWWRPGTIIVISERWKGGPFTRPRNLKTT